MKLHVLHDAKGRILAAVRLNSQAKGSVPRPVVGRGQKTLEVEVPAEHRDHDLRTICQNLRVDVKLRKLVATKKQATR